MDLYQFVGRMPRVSILHDLVKKTPNVSDKAQV